MILAATAGGVLLVDEGLLVPVGGRVTSLAGSAGGAVAVVDGRRIVRSADGRRWTSVVELPPPEARCVLPLGDDLLVGTAEAALFRVSGASVARVIGFDRVAGRDSWHTPWGGPPDTRSLARDADGAIYANVHVGGIPRSRDGGASWEPTIDVDADVHQVRSEAGLLLAPCASGLAVGRSGGERWRIDRDGLHANYCRAVAVAGDTVLLSASTGPFTRQAAVYRRPLDGDGVFQRCTDGLPEWFGSNVDTHALAAAGDRAAIAVDDRVWVSEDAGRSWGLAADDAPGAAALALLEAA